MIRYRSILATGIVLALLAEGIPVPAQGTAAPAAGAATASTPAMFSSEQLEQMVAPIALYPDGLLMQIFMAATYPLEIVQAARWREKNPDLKGTDLEEALKQFDWDDNVKSLTGFPDVLKKMYDNLDWTQDVGDAVLGQRADLMDAVQRMRGKASDSGNLKTTEQQVVTKTEEKIIVIESKDPEVIYVPQYSPTVVYAGWGYPSYYYPPFYAPPPPGYGFMAFSAGVAWGAAVWGDANWGWGSGDIDIDVDHNYKFKDKTQNNFNKNEFNQRNQVNQRGGKEGFKHNPEHRGGVGYRDQKTASQYGGSGASNRVSRDQARGHTGTAGNRPTAGTRDTGVGRGGQSAMGSDRSAARPNTGASQRPSTGSRDSAYSGSRNSGMDRSASSRGASSRGSRSYGGSSSSRGGGGMSRGGGGMSRGGGGRGGGRR